MPTLHQVVSALYGLDAVILSLMYIPQIIAAWKDQRGAVALSLTTWTYWTLSSLNSLLYAGIVNGDKLFILVALANTAGTATVLGVAYWRRRQHRLQGTGG